MMHPPRIILEIFIRRFSRFYIAVLIAIVMMCKFWNGSAPAGSSIHSVPLFISQSIVRFFQFVLGLAVIGLYATDLDTAHKAAKYTDGKWAYAVAVGVLSAITSLLYLVPQIPWIWGNGWDAVLCILWTAVFGIFGRMYINADPGYDPGISRMKRAVWLDLTCMLLWLSTTGLGLAIWSTRGRLSLYTGRASV